VPRRPFSLPRLRVLLTFLASGQAEDRCHRLGQEKEVTVIKLIASNSIDAHILKMANQKKEFSEVMLGEGAFEDKENNDELDSKNMVSVLGSLVAEHSAESDQK